MRLAVVIPFFKTAYLGDTLCSIQGQTCRDFRLYFAADGVPIPPEILRPLRQGDWHSEPVIAEFPENLGRTNPARHWNRSIALTSEEWVWLFSDDDLMSSDCVAAFKGMVATAMAAGCSVLRFPTAVIDHEGAVLRESPPNPLSERWDQLAVARFVSHREFFIQNHVFRRQAWEKAGGFADLRSGFLSDEMSFARFARPGVLMTIPGGKVFWRQSGINLNSSNPAVVDLKWEAFFGYLHFLEKEVFPDDRVARRRHASMTLQWFVKAAANLGSRPSLTTFFRLLPLLLRICPAEFPWLFPAVLRLLSTSTHQAG